VNKTINYVPASGPLDRFGQAMNWFFVGMLILSGAVYFTNGIRYDTTSAGPSPLVAVIPMRCRAEACSHFDALLVTTHSTNIGATTDARPCDWKRCRAVIAACSSP
jgi:hypothetical protein